MERARRAGLDAAPRVSANDGPIAETILAHADEIGADLIVVDASRLIGREGLMLGSVFQSLVRETDRPVLVVPSRELVSKRSRHRHHDARNIALPGPVGRALHKWI